MDLNNVDPKYVIEADLNDISSTQVIKVSQTVNFDEDIPYKPISNATVVVTDVQGNELVFTSVGDGSYVRSNFRPILNGKYSLKVVIGNEVFLSTTQRFPYVDIDSFGIEKKKIFNEDYYIVAFRFNDPIDVENYYKYSYSVNGGPFRFSSVYSDKFNNGLFVTHEIVERDEDKKVVKDDLITVRRECISKDVFTFWSQLEGLNPGSAAPANPDSNISNGAVGYFSVSSARLYTVKIEDI